MSRRYLRGTLILLRVLIATAALGIFTFAGQARAAENLILGLDADDINTLDPAFVDGSEEFAVRQIFNTLVSPPDGTLEMGLDKLQGELAESWSVSDDRKVWTFKLKPGIKWHHGYGEVTAEDVKFSYERQMDPATNATYASNYANVESIEIIDPLTVAFHLKKPSAFFHVTALMPRFGGYVVSKKAYEALGKDFAMHPIGTGPFQFESYTSKQGIMTSANPDYFGGPQKVAGIDFRFVLDGNARVVGLMGAEFDIIEGVREPGWVEKLKQNYPDAQIQLLFPGSSQTVHLNLTVPPFDDIRVRQAMAYALDPSVWRQSFGVLNEPMWGLTPQAFYGGLTEADIPAELRYDYNPEKAKQLLAEAGYPNGVTISAYNSDRADYKTNMLLIQDLFRKVGINLDVRFIDHATAAADNLLGKNNITIVSTTAPPNALPLLKNFYHSASIVTKPTGSRNVSHYGDVVGNVDGLLEKAETETDPQQQIAELHEIQLQLLRDLPALRLQTLGGVKVSQPWVKLPYEVKTGLGHYSLAGVELVK